jgi:hypothetical protein
MKPPRQTQRKFAFKLSYSTTTTKNKETLHISIDLLFINYHLLAGVFPDFFLPGTLHL